MPLKMTVTIHVTRYWFGAVNSKNHIALPAEDHVKVVKHVAAENAHVGRLRIGECGKLSVDPRDATIHIDQRKDGATWVNVSTVIVGSDIGGASAAGPACRHHSV